MTAFLDLSGPFGASAVEPFHATFPPAFIRIHELHELRELVDDPCTVVVDGRLVVPAATVAGRDPGGLEV